MMSRVHSSNDADARVANVVKLLRARGYADTRVTAAGHKGDIAAIEISPEHVLALAELAPEIKSLGFSYVAVELLPEEESA